MSARLSHSTTHRVTRRQMLTALVLLSGGYARAASPPDSVAPAIAEATKKLFEKKFAEAISVLEGRQKELGAKITDDETGKRYEHAGDDASLLRPAQSKSPFGQTRVPAPNARSEVQTGVQLRYDT